MGTRERLDELGITLPQPPEPAGAYTRAVRSGNLLFVAGQLPLQDQLHARTAKCEHIARSLAHHPKGGRRPLMGRYRAAADKAARARQQRRTRAVQREHTEEESVIHELFLPAAAPGLRSSWRPKREPVQEQQ